MKMQTVEKLIRSDCPPDLGLLSDLGLHFLPEKT